MPTSNNYPQSIQRWLDSQTGITGSTTGSQRDFRQYTGQKLTSTDSPTRPLTFNGVNIIGHLVKKASPQLGIGTYVPAGMDGSAYYTNRLYASTPSQPDAVLIARGKAWAKLMDKVKGDTSSLAVTAAEGREAFVMVAKRVTGLYRAYRHLRKGEFKQFCKELSVDPKRKHRSLVRSASNEASGLWLEYWFGWSPTVQEIGSTAMALSVNPVLATVTERAGSGFKLTERSVTVGNTSKRTIKQSGKGVVRHGAKFTLSNENLFLANRLGLINPMLVAWEVVPFSFVVDWFTKFGSYLESFTDLAGLTVSQPWSAQYTRCSQYTTIWNPPNTLRSCETSWDQHFLVRGTSLYRPVPVTPRLVNFGDSVTRAATAVSLLTALFLKGK